MKNKYNQLREEIILAVPEIMEWKNGCKVLDVDGDIYDVSAYEFSYEEVKCLVKKIIGRPITLEDCLIALENKKQIKVSTGDFEGCEEDKKCIKEEYNVSYDFRKLLYLWIPNKPLQDQSNEVHNLLWDLICKDG